MVTIIKLRLKGKMKKSVSYIVNVLSFVVVLIFLSSSVFAITGSIGNARMILRAEQGDSIEKYILVKNVNNVSVNIELSASGDLEDYVDIKDSNFSLGPEEEKKAYFTIQAAKPGTTETKINVKFSPVDGKNGVGLSSTVIVITKETGWFDWLGDDSEEDEGIGVEPDDNSAETKVDNPKSLSGKSLVLIGLLITTLIVTVAFVLVLIWANKKRKKKRAVRSS